MAEFVKTVNHGTAQINLSHLPKIMEMRPTELHMRENGSVSNEPSFCFVFTVPEMKGKIVPAVIGQFTLATLKDCLNELGYDVVKK